MSMSKKVSRRDFARTSVAAGAAAAAIPAVLLGKEPVAATGSPIVKAAAVAAARRRRISMPPELAYGGISHDNDGRDMWLEHTLTPAGQTAPSYPGGWKEGTTPPAEYYYDEKIYAHDERFLAENFWFMVDHQSRIPKAGDYFVFEWGRGESVIVLRNQAGEIQAYHNVCRHRGSRLCQGESARPTEAQPNGQWGEKNMSVVQLGPSGNTPVFRCPYHAWTYDLTGKLVSYPQGMPNTFDATEHGLLPCHLQMVGGFIWLSLSKGEAPEFEPWVGTWRAAAEAYGTADLKIAARASAPTKANWKLVIENFRECYHCYPSHTKSYSVVHQIYGDPGFPNAEKRRTVEEELARHGHAPQRGGGMAGGMAGAAQRGAMRGQDDPIEGPTRQAQAPPRPTMGGHLAVGFLTGTLDGRPVAPLLPLRKEWTHTGTRSATGFSTSWMMAYDDHVVVVRFAPRGADLTDAEIFWLVNPTAKEGRDYDVKKMEAVWLNTYREDRWLSENQQLGILSGRYNLKGGQPYAAQEGGPAGFIKWYMREIASRIPEQQTTAE